MFNNLLILILLLSCLFSAPQISLAQNTGDTVDVNIPSGGVAQCTFNGKIPIHRIKATNNNLVTDPITGKTSVSINSDAETNKSIINVNILASIEALSAPAALLSGEKITFESNTFDLNISSENKKNGKITNITNETADGEKTTASATILVKSFENNQAAGSIKITFKNTKRTIEKLEEEIETTPNGDVIVRCNFAGIPVTIPFTLPF